MGQQARADDELLHAPLVIEYGFNRTTGPVVGAFLTGLREQRVFGIRGVDGRVVCPPVEYDPATGEPLTEMVEVGAEGTVTSWSWVPTDREAQPLPAPYALAMVRLDGADTSMLHVVDAGSPDSIATGDRVRIRWADERTGSILDIACFEPAGGAS
ncbi:MAG: Zn-ribbon domain-containing OB-fold protein [Microthrixaceae bacterium]